jgi:hypothetical protein
MTEEINIRQTAEETTGTAAAGQPAFTGEARRSAERKPMISWAALLQEAVTKPGFIHEASTRFQFVSWC